MTLTSLETLYEAAVAAMESGQYATAILELMAIKTRLAITPNLAKSIGSAGTSSITWNPVEIDSLITQCQRLQAQTFGGGGPFQQTKVAYARPGLIG